MLCDFRVVSMRKKINFVKDGRKEKPLLTTTKTKNIFIQHMRATTWGEKERKIIIKTNKK